MIMGFPSKAYEEDLKIRNKLLGAFSLLSQDTQPELRINTSRPASGAGK
jgi:hypothetical protein